MQEGCRSFGREEKIFVRPGQRTPLIWFSPARRGEPRKIMINYFETQDRPYDDSLAPDAHS
jgi:hypothetical protein